MLPHPAFVLANSSWEQSLAFVGMAIAYIAFLIWIAYLVRS